MLTANKTGIFQNFFSLLFFASQIGERVNDDTKNEVEDNNDDDEEEEEVVDNTGSKQRLLKAKNRN